MQEKFRLFAERIATLAGTPWAFSAALVLVILWIVSGPMFGFSDTWQLVINTGTTIVTFLMVFLIQNAQNRDTVAIQLKLDELLRAVEGARTGLINVDQLSDVDLARVRAQFKKLGEEGEVSELSTTVQTESNVDIESTGRGDDGQATSEKVEGKVRKHVTTTVKRSDGGDDRS